jgi:rubrerythrin
MTSLCDRLHAAKDDEANGIIEYENLKDLLTSKEHIELIENIILDESRHLGEILTLIKDLDCPEPVPVIKKEEREEK